jgi:peptide/nickel transport system substrate-binding protein
MHRSRRRRLFPLICIAATVAVTAACGGEGGTADRGTALTIAAQAEPDNVEPCNSQDARAVVLRHNVVQPLTDLDPNTGDVIPELALSWERQDPTTWIFKLRPGVTFHDGAPFNAAAAVFGLNRTLNESALKDCTTRGKVNTKVTPSAVDDLTLKVVTEKPDPILPRELSYVDLVSPNTSTTEFTDHPIGTGPYTWGTWNRGLFLEINRWDGYWGEKPAATKVRVVARTEASVRANMVKTGEADIAFPVAEVDATHDDRTRPFTENRIFFLRLPIQTAPFTDIRVRQAVAYAINKDQLASAIMKRTGRPADQIVTETVNGFVPGYQGSPFDPAKAKELVASAKADGVPVDAPVDLVTETGKFAGSDEIVQAVQQMLQDAGLGVHMRGVELGAWQQLLRKPPGPEPKTFGQFPPNQTPTVLTVSHDNVAGDAAFSFPNYLTSKGCCTTANNPEVDQLVSQALAAEGDERARLFQQAAQTEYTQEAALVPLVEQLSLMLISPRIEYQPNGLTGAQLLLRDVSFTSPASP